MIALLGAWLDGRSPLFIGHTPHTRSAGPRSDTLDEEQTRVDAVTCSAHRGGCCSIAQAAGGMT